jgi:hypothetical protein
MMYEQPHRINCLLLGLILTFLSPGAAWAAKAERRVYENDALRLTVTPRTAQQMAAFYEGRGFPARAITLTRGACFFTVGIHNKSRDIVWLATANWQFQTAGGPLKRITRDEWKQRWQQLGLALPYQSTFRWTLLPASLDFQPDEREGGNITLSRTDKPFSLHATFATGKDKQGPRIDVHIADLRCAAEQP